MTHTDYEITLQAPPGTSGADDLVRAVAEYARSRGLQVLKANRLGPAGTKPAPARLSQKRKLIRSQVQSGNYGLL